MTRWQQRQFIYKGQWARLGNPRKSFEMPTNSYKYEWIVFLTIGALFQTHQQDKQCRMISQIPDTDSYNLWIAVVFPLPLISLLLSECLFHNITILVRKRSAVSEVFSDCLKHFTHCLQILTCKCHKCHSQIKCHYARSFCCNIVSRRAEARVQLKWNSWLLCLSHALKLVKMCGICAIWHLQNLLITLKCMPFLVSDMWNIKVM